ncbi:MAG: DUF4382 domain-containing protein [Nanoarchaeota archaeon]
MIKSTKAQIGIIAIVLGVLVVVGIAGYLYMNPAEKTDLNPLTSNEQGEVVFAVTDAAANMENVQEVRVTVDKVEAHYSSETEADASTERNAESQTESEGWATLSTQDRTYALLELDTENKNELLLAENITARNYNRVRLYVKDVVVVDNEGEHQAKLPSNMLQFNTDVNVDANSTATVLFDFKADESLHVTGNGEYILAPVVMIESRSNAEAEVRSDNSVEFRGGNVDTSVTVGTDLDGNVGIGVRVPANANISIESDGFSEIGLGGSGSSDMEASGSS